MHSKNKNKNNRVSGKRTKPNRQKQYPYTMPVPNRSRDKEGPVLLGGKIAFFREAGKYQGREKDGKRQRRGRGNQRQEEGCQGRLGVMGRECLERGEEVAGGVV